MKKEITWINTKGNEIKITIELVKEKLVDLDGNKFMTACCEIDTVATIDGKTEGTYIQKHAAIKNINGFLLAGQIGKIAISKENMDKIDAAMSEIKESEAWQAKKTKEKAAIKANDEYYKHHNSVKKMMNM